MASSLPYMGSQTVPGDQLPGGWHPTVGYMIAFVVGEMIVFHILSKHLNIA